MCGIFGTFGAPHRGLDDASLALAMGALNHRGPEGRGVVRTSGVMLGHTRLRIIDLTEAGAQPMSSADGSVRVTFNGEIYNHQRLREELRSRGHVFRSRCDTEVLVHGYLEWGERLPERLDGMFAFAIWDEREQQLMLARDRAGEKPLFYAYDDATGVLLFASEIKALFPLGAPLRIRGQGLPMLLGFGYVPAPHTLYQGIEQLPPATSLIITPGNAPRMQVYWKMPFAEEPQATLTTEAKERVRHLVVESIRSRLEADVPLGAFLSGGIDSSIIVAVMSQLLNRQIKTFSIGFAGDARFDETRYARMVSQAFGTEHVEFVIEPQGLDMGQLIGELVWLHDGPFGDSSAIPTYIVAKLTREHVTVALTGDGGDELFCGYARLIAAEAAEHIPAPALRIAKWIGQRLPGAAFERSPLARANRFLSVAALPLPDRVARWNSMFLSDLGSLLRQDVQEQIDLEDPLSWQRAIFAGLRGASPLAQVLQHNFTTYLPYDLLVKVDRAAMAHSLETRAPFLATGLMEYAATLPNSYRRRGLLTKRILREAFADLLPPQICSRGKMGFGMPLGTWFRGALRTYLLDHLGPSARIYDYLDRRTVASYLSQHLLGQEDHSHRLWTLLTMEIWLRALPQWGSS